MAPPVLVPYLEAVIHVVHHPDYVTAAPARSTYRWGKNGLIRDLLLAEGQAVAWHEPEPMPRAWLEAAHDPGICELRSWRRPSHRSRNAASAFR